MRVKIGNKIYDSLKEPIMIIFDEGEQEKIANMGELSRKLDAELAVKYYGWEWVNYHGKTILIPPADDEMIYWTGIWDENGIPHFLPRYSEMEGEYHVICPFCKTEDKLYYDLFHTEEGVPYDGLYCENCKKIIWEEEHD